MKGGSGRTAIAPEILFTSWLYATLEGVGTSRELARLTPAHDAYRWICGWVLVNYHTLSDFRTAHTAALDGLLSDSIAGLMAAGAVTLQRVAQDGMRLCGSAGAASLRRGENLERCLEEARAQVQALKQQREKDPGAVTPRQQAARERAAPEHQERVEKALVRLSELAEPKVKRGKQPKAARASTTAAEDTVMMMVDGGFRPACNARYATDAESQVIVGVAAVTIGSDLGQRAPMVAPVGAVPRAMVRR